jgi:hypothetical protein
MMEKYYVKLLFLLAFLNIPSLLYPQGFNGYSWGTTKSMIINNKGRSDVNSTLGRNGSSLHYNEMEISGYYANIVFVFVQDKLYLGTYIFDSLTREGTMTAYFDLLDRLVSIYGRYNQIDYISNNVLEQNKSPYVTTWHYNEQLIQLILTYQITGTWGISIRYHIDPQVAIIASGGIIRDYKGGDL